MIALSEAGLSVQSQKPVKVRFREKPVGDFYADLLVEEEVVVELKVAKTLVPEHAAQTINYLNATGIQVGLLINFGKPTLEFKRFTRSNTDEQEYKTAVSRKAGREVAAREADWLDDPMRVYGCPGLQDARLLKQSCLSCPSM